MSRRVRLCDCIKPHAFDAYLYRFHKPVSLAANAVVKKDVVLVFLGELLHPFQETLLYPFCTSTFFSVSFHIVYCIARQNAG
jgi:hypothetical protein